MNEHDDKMAIALNKVVTDALTLDGLTIDEKAKWISGYVDLTEPEHAFKLVTALVEIALDGSAASPGGMRPKDAGIDPTGHPADIAAALGAPPKTVAFIRDACDQDTDD